MSLDQRCQQFHEAALGTSKSKGPLKEIATLRKFLHKNQDQRFTDKGVSRLFDTIQIYVNNSNNLLPRDCKEDLLEDALKMPFTVFNTKQKKSMLKWLEDVRGEGGGKPKQAIQEISQRLTLIDLNDADGKITLMHDETGDTFEQISLPAGEMGISLKKAFENVENVVVVEAIMESDSVARIKRVILE